MYQRTLFLSKSRSLGSSAVALALVAVLVLGCEDRIVAPDTASEVPLRTTSAISTVTSFDASAGENPESVAVDRFGNIYVSMSNLGEIWKLDPSGSFEAVVATFPVDGGFGGVGGLRFDVRGALYVMNSSANNDVRGVWTIASGGEKERIAGTSGMSLPNDAAISPNGTVYITDSVEGAVWRVLRGGQAEVWVQDEALEGTGAYGLGIPIGANGIVVVRGGLLVANAEKGQLVSVPIRPDGRAGQPTVVIADPALFGLDGITADARGNIYGAVNAGYSVVRISRDGTDLSEIASGAPLDFPTGLTFGAGRGRHTLFIVNSAFLSAPEDANPAVLSVRVGR